MVYLILRIGNLSAGIQASFRGLEYPFHLRLPSTATFPIITQKWPASHRNARPTCVGIRNLVAVMDVFSHYIISWRLANTLEPGFCCEALKEALESGCPEYFNTDQGAQFTRSEFLSILQGEEIKISMDGKGRVIDNIFIERFWRTLKYEEVYTKCYETVAECRASIGEFIRKYNEERLHQSLGAYDTLIISYQ